VLDKKLWHQQTIHFTGCNEKVKHGDRVQKTYFLKKPNPLGFGGFIEFWAVPVLVFRIILFVRVVEKLG